MRIIRPLLLDIIRFFIIYGVIAVAVEKLAANLPRSWDPTGMGMVAMILLFFGFVYGAYRIGASYSDDLEVQAPGTVIGLLRRPVRSAKYGFISLAASLGLLYALVWLSSLVFH